MDHTESLKRAREEFNSDKTEALELLDMLRNRIARNDPEELHWGHTGSMKHILAELRELEATTRRHS